MANESEAMREWREATPDDSDEGSSGSGSSSDGTTKYEGKELTPRSQKKPRGEEANDPDFDLLVKTQGSRKQP